MTLDSTGGRALVIGALALLALVFFLTASAHFDYTPDDSYIYFRYAVNIAAGEGISFNPGEPSFGFTSPLWLGILAGAAAAGADVELAAKSLDLLFASLTIMLFFLAAYEILRDAAAAFLASLAWSVNAWLLRWAGSGLETSLAVFLVLATLLFLLRNRYRESALLLGLLILTRPEAVLFAPALAVDYYFNRISGGISASRLRGAATLAGMTAIVVVPWLIAAWAMFGTVIPSTLQAKQGTGGFADMLTTLEDLAVSFGSADGFAICILAVSVVVVRFVRARPDPDEKFFLFRQGLAGWIWLLLLPAGYALMSVNVVSRYLIIATPLIGLLAYLYLQRAIPSAASPALRLVIVFAATALIMTQNQYIYATHVRPHLSSFTAGMEDSLIPIGRYLQEHSPEGTVVFAADVGALGYFSHRIVCDYNRIISPPGSGTGGPDFTAAVRSGAYRDCGAEYVLHRSYVLEELSGVPDLVPVFSRPFGQLSISDPRTVHFTLYKTGRTGRAGGADVTLR